MSGWDSLETAAKARDIIKRGVNREIQTSTPRPIVGRVITVDLPNQSAMVWFAGDEQPMPVRLFSSTIPASWSRRGFPTNVTSTDTQGYGSMAVCHRYNGVLYITDVITGGQFSYQLQTLGFNVAYMLPHDGTGDIAGESHEAIMAMRISSLDPVDQGDAVMFGPFLRWSNDEPSGGVIKVKVNGGFNVREYEFTLSYYDLVNPADSDDYLDRWFRILPRRSSGDIGGSRIEWDLDVAFRETIGGLDSNNFQSREVWFRLVNQNTASSYMTYTVTVSTEMFHRNIGWDQKYISVAQVSGPEILGYLGYDNSGIGFRDASNTGFQDNFGRVGSNTLGSADTGETYSYSSTASSYNTDGVSANAVLGASNQYLIAYLTPTVDGNNVDVSIEAEFSVSATASGADIYCSVIYRYADINNYYFTSLIFKTNGQIHWAITRRLAGVDAFVASGTTATTYAANAKYSVLAACVGSYHEMRFWATGTEMPALPQGSGTNAAITATGAVGIFLIQPGVGTNTYPITLSCHKIRSEQIHTAKAYYSSTLTAHSGSWDGGLIHLAKRLQHLVTFSVPPRWNGTHLSWTGYVQVGGAGANRNGLRHGRAWAGLPASGRTIPQIPAGTFATCTSDGIPLGAGQSLWLGLRPGSRQLNQEHSFFIMSEHVDTFEDIEVPEWAVMIAYCPNDETGFVRLGNGETLDYWRNLTYNSGWSDFAASWHGAQYRKMGDMVKMRGLVKNTVTTALGDIGTLPVGYRPPKNVIFATQSADAVHGGTRLDVLDTGAVNVPAHWGGGAAFLSLEPIYFSLLL